ncbi:hypothetical protein QTO34_018675 [Cnephaeus nilssonii]|uniref:Uncharacterized protein n=1 Tax=Cnephaeus nilssonii TaxID=3371016 RepID=A0AA40LN95_CNENI|nr:hypothetical protein QTO34_018675 [Eptesicus nilssonii]
MAVGRRRPLIPPLCSRGQRAAPNPPPCVPAWETRARGLVLQGGGTLCGQERGQAQPGRQRPGLGRLHPRAAPSRLRGAQERRPRGPVGGAWPRGRPGSGDGERRPGAPGAGGPPLPGRIAFPTRTAWPS